MQPFTFFISYRRLDTAPIALLLKYEIEKRLQFVRVSVDVEEIRHGDTFPGRIRGLIDKAHATIVLIGKSWMPRRDVFNHVTVSLTTWDARRRVTIYDLNLALFMNKAARAVMAR